MVKSHVSMEQGLCPICGRTEDTGAILLHRRMKQVLDTKTVTGWTPCAEHKKMIDDGYVMLVAVDAEKSEKELNGTIKIAGAWRMGPIVGLKKEAYENIFGEKAPKGWPMAFCEEAVVEHLKTIAHPSDLPPEKK